MQEEQVPLSNSQPQNRILDAIILDNYQLTIEEIISKYPYFQSAFLQKLLSVENNSPEQFLSNLLSVSIVFPNRNILIKHYIDMVVRHNKEAVISQTSIETMIKAIQEKLVHINSELVDNKPIRKSYTLELRTVEEPQLSEKQLRKKALMEDFIKKSPSISRPPAAFSTPSETYSKPSIDTGNIVSETLAIIYAKQGNNDMANSMYLKLIELYPEKTDYFKSKIDELKK